jgi:PAS domain S-box-containing protein
MERLNYYRREISLLSTPNLGWRISSYLACGAAVILLVIIYAEQTHKLEAFAALLVAACIVFCVLILLHARFLYLAREQQRQTRTALDQTEREFQSVFENALDTILIIDDHGVCLDANPSACQLLGATRSALLGQSLASFYKNANEFGDFRERLRKQERDQGQVELVRRYRSEVFVEFTAKADFLPGKHVMILRDITRRRQAEEEVERNLALAQSAWSEADAMRIATLALTQDLRMDVVLDTLLQSLGQLVPYQAAQVLLVEADSRLFLAREATSENDAGLRLECPRTLDAADHPIMQAVLTTQECVLLPDTREAPEWRAIEGHTEVRSWLAVPLVAAQQTLGLLSLEHTVSNSLTQEHLRIAKSIAIPAAVAIQNARLYERAEIYGEELERRLLDLRDAKQALEQSEENCRASEDRFQKVFRSSPIAFSITTLIEGRYIDVNEGFERRYGFARAEVLGRTSQEIRLWDDLAERTKLVEHLRRGSAVRNSVTKFRAKSGEIIVSAYSADTIQLEGQACLLIVSENLPSCGQQQLN